ncbi:hypothetical protein A4A49_52017 [Nicotiana attenuata]|uniref:DUF4283 domain-containing protein n=1 Tax=Nicotiana attenuata TaxID=49451 RepID=A0A1J6IW26_NICAT|nr:hypothetical protein A4A49_52017 [Nicotiana attenuata]
MVRFADRCKFTVVGKFSNTITRIEVIRRSFIDQTELRGAVKITYFNARTVYIDLDNEFDHSTPNEDLPSVPIWVVIPELPCHLYYMEILTPLLSPIGKSLYLDLASFQKTRGSVAKVKIQIDLTKERPHYVRLGYDEEQDKMDMENGRKHLGHSEYTCEIRLKEEEKKKRKEEEAAETSNSRPTNHKKSKEEAGINKKQMKEHEGITKSNAQDKRKNHKTAEYQKEAEHQSAVAEITEEEWQTQRKKNFKGTSQSKIQQQVYMPKQSNTQQQQVRSVDSGVQNQPIPPIPPSISADCEEIPIARQEGVPNGEGFPHVLHECANAQLNDHRIDQPNPHYESVTIEEDSESFSSEEDPSAQMKALLKGKAKVAADFQRKAMRNKNVGISINEPPDDSVFEPCNPAKIQA